MQTTSDVYPGRFFLDGDVQRLTAYLVTREWLLPEENIQQVARAGAGNMNCVFRVITSQRSFILKQSRPWVEKYPQIAAPWDRALVEASFYRVAQDYPAVKKYLPELFAVDPDERLLFLEDLVEAQDFSLFYGNAQAIGEPDANQLVDFLLELHGSTRSPKLRAGFSNQEMRVLNHEHIFHLPLRPNELDLDSITPGLAQLANELQQDSRYCRIVDALGARYLDTIGGECLVHGDYIPGSWLRSQGRIYIIDPEFCFFGPPEWDLAVMFAHFYLSRQTPTVIQAALQRYITSSQINLSLVWQFAGVEIMRRLIGVAQLPVAPDLEWKAQLLQRSRHLVLKGHPI